MRQAILAKYKNGNHAIKITFPYKIEGKVNNDDLTLVRSLPNRKRNKEQRFWHCPISIEAVKKLKEAGFSVDERLLDFLKRSELNVDDVKEIEIPGLKKTPYPYQKRGISFINEKRGRGLIGDEMGLGKTLQALGYLQLYPEKRPAIVVCPSSLKLNWEQEIKDTIHTNDKVQILNGQKPYKTTGDILIINYEILSYWTSFLKKTNPVILIIDEAHKTKNGAAKRTAAVRRLAKNCKHIIALTGTPLESRPIELYNIIKIINPTIFPDKWKYKERYCDLKHNGWGWDDSGASNTAELHEVLTSTIMIRRMKKDVLTDLPDKQVSLVPFDIDLKKYHKLQSELIDELELNPLSVIEELKQEVARLKMKACKEWINDFFENNDKLVIFCTHKFVVYELMKEYKDIAVKVDGSVTGTDRKKAVDAFQNNPKIKLFIGNIQAAGVGLTLTASSNVAFFEFPWTPGELNQAIDRCHRIGQKDTVNAWLLFARYTIEKTIVQILNNKMSVVNSVLDGKETDEDNIFNELIDTLKNKNHGTVRK